MSKASRQEQRERLRQHMEELGYIYEETGRGFAAFVAAAADFIGGAIMALLWIVFVVAACVAIFGSAGFLLGLLAGLLGVFQPGCQRFLLLVAISAIPGALIAAPVYWLIGGSFSIWWLIATITVIAVIWAKTVTAPVATPQVEAPSPLGSQRFANPNDVRNTEGITYE